MKTIFLIGYMGCGKSTLGKALAQRCDIEFIDLDVYIETRTGKKIREIFADEGEAAFRELEREMLLEVSEKLTYLWHVAAGLHVSATICRVLEWILKRCSDTPVEAEETAIGYVPKAEDIDLSDMDYEITAGKKFGINDLKSILTVDKEKWAKEAEEIEGYYNNTIKDRIPQELWDCLNTLKNN